MSAPAACLFDLDGLLLDTEPLHGKAWAAAAKHFGSELSETQLKQLRGRRRQDCAEQVIRWLERSITPEDLLAVQQPFARRLLAGAPAMPGAKALLRTCWRLDIAMALVTSSAEEAVRRKCEPHPWLTLIETRVLGDDQDLRQGKPAADPFLLAADRLGVDVRACWALEDSLAGSRAALAAGCRLWLLDADNSGIDSAQLPQGTWQKILHLNEVEHALIGAT